MKYLICIIRSVATKNLFILKVLALFALLLLSRLSFSQTTYMVTSNADSGPNTLRQAIINANGNLGSDIINFNFGAQTTITLATCLPQINSPVLIDGYSEPTSGAGNLKIEVISTPAGCNIFDFIAGSSPSTIRGLVLSGGTNGVRLASTGHTVKGNYIGTNVAGTAAAASKPQNCILLDAGTNCTIGGTGGQIDRNILSGATQDGIRVSNNSTGVVIINNYIGTDATGNVGIGNTSHGIEGYGSSHNPRVGGTTLAERNVISANGANGVYFNLCQAPVVKGNILGMGANGTTMLGNVGSGADCENTGAGTPPLIGGPTLAERNYSSCNHSFGVVIRFAPGGIIQNNWLGVDMATGNLNYGNWDAGITVTNTADVQCLNNICSGNGVVGVHTGADGISIWSTSPRPIVKGNVIGLGADLTTPLQNVGHGVECLTCDDGFIGGTTLAERNLISTSFNRGIQCVNSPRLTMINNYIGTDVTGLLDCGGTEMGISIANSTDVVVGGSTANTGNVISGNAGSGIEVTGNSPNVVIKGNIIGLGSDGVTKIRNDQYGVKISSNQTTNSTVGGPTVLERNIISGNGTATSHHGISIDGGANTHSIVNNYIGTDITGTIAKGNAGSGININNVTTVTIDQNISSANGFRGIELATTTANTVTRNKIGTDISGNLNFGNGSEGVRFTAVSTSNMVGGSLANANIIANNNGGSGVWVEASAQKNTITFNSIFCNAGLGIDLQGAGNESVLPPVITSSTAMNINGTGVTGNVIHVYRNVKGDGGVKCNCEGEIYIGTVAIVGGLWSLTHNLGLTAAEAASATATQTTPLGSTSEFTPCTTPLPVQLISFIVDNYSEGGVLVSWSTATEKNNKFFEIMSSTDGIHFTVIGTVSGNGNSTSLNNYSFVDKDPTENVNYYQLRQVDYNNEYSLSAIRSINLSVNEFSVVAGQNGFTIIDHGSKISEFSYNVYSITGGLVATGKTSLTEGSLQQKVNLSLSDAMYIVCVSGDGKMVREKMLIAE